jgi:superfamily II DNA or RNA helicase
MTTSTSALSGSPIILANKLYVPKRLVGREDLERWGYDWVDIVVEEEEDEFGNVKLDRSGKPVTVSTHVEKRLRSYEQVYTHSRRYIAFPRGNLQKISPYLKDASKVIDLRNIPPLGFHLKLKKRTVLHKKYPPQKTCISDWLRHGYGIIQGDTGSGKTVIGIGLVIKTGLKTIILSKRQDAFKQWRSEFETHTNILKLEESLDRTLVGEYKTTKKNSVYPITLATVQSFMKGKGRQRIVELQDEFGLMILDEAHELCTEEFKQPIQFFNVGMWAGLTATPERNDGNHLLLYDLIGPVITRNKVKQMKPTVTFIDTGEEAPSWLYGAKKFPRHYKWSKALAQLSTSKRRRDLILEYVEEDAADGRQICCFAERRAIVRSLYDELIKHDYKVAYVDGTTKKREEIYEGFREGKIQILCAGKVLDALVNLPKMDSMHVCSPVNNHTRIMQIYGRARREVAGKRTPLIRYYVDGGGQFQGAYNNNKRICKLEGWDVESIDGSEKILGKWQPLFNK